MRVDSVLVIALVAFAGSWFVEAPLATVLGGAFCLWLLRRELSRTVLAAALLLAVLSAYRVDHARSDFEARRVAARDALGAPLRCAFTGEVLHSPTWRGEALAYAVRAGALSCEERELPAGLTVRLYGGPRQLGRGDVVDVVAKLAPVRIFRNAGLLNPVLGAARSGAVLSGSSLAVGVVARGAGPSAWVDRARGHVRDRIEATFAGPAVGMAKALVLGENDLSDQDDDAFKRSGLAHLLAVSGTHLVFAVAALVQALIFLLVRLETLAARHDVARLASAVGVPLALGYADFAGGSGSAWRAAWMLSAAFGARAVARRPRAARAVAASIFIGVAVDPLAAFDLSFLLSLAATGGLILLGQPWTQRLRVRGQQALNFLVAAALATVSSMLPCAPLLALLSSQLTLAGIGANVVAGPFGEAVALPLCLGHALLSWFPELERGVALVASGALLVVKQVAHTSAAARWTALPVPLPGAWHFTVLCVGVVALFAPLRGTPLSKVQTRRRHVVLGLALVTALLVVELAQIRQGQPRGELRVTTLDVGQGDATLVDLPNGGALLIDGGGFVGSPVDPGDRVLLPMLRARRRATLDVVVLSHPHPDHFGGLLRVAEQVPIGEFWDTGQGEVEGAGPQYAELLATLRRHGTKILRPRELCGAREVGGAQVEVLGPCPDFTPNANANDNSIVLRMTYGDHSALFMGDAEAEEERHLLETRPGALDADLLKVGHHGSRTSTSPELLRQVTPLVATLSCGLRNRFGHPHPQTLLHLSDAHVPALRLDRTGSVQWTTRQPARVRLFDVPH